MFKVSVLPVFYADLRAHGFAIGIAEQQRVHRLLLHLHATDTFPSSGRLCNMLAAVLSTSEEQQRHFRQRFQHFFGSAPESGGASEENGQEEGKTPAPGGATARTVLTGARDALVREARQFQRRVIIAVIVAALLLVFLPHFTIVVVPPRHDPASVTDQPPAPKPQKVERPQPRATDTGGLERAKQWLSDWGSGPLASMRRAFDKPESLMGLCILFLAFLPFVGLALWAAAPTAKTHAVLRRRKVEGKAALVKLLLSSPTYNPFDRDAVHRHSQLLRRPRMVASDELDVDSTIAASFANGGLFTPIYARRPVAPEYLVLVERNGKDDHVTRYAESLLSVLKTSQIYADVYYFEGDFRRVYRNNETARIPFEELAGRHGGHRLVLMTKGNGMINPVSGKIENWALQATQFERRICLTPTPPALWGYRELEISEALDLMVLPLLPENIPLAVQVLASDQPPLRHSVRTDVPEEARVAAERLAEVLESRPQRWLSSGKPNGATLKTFEAAAREALRPEGYRWLSACAVYPELNWNLTLHLGESLRDNRGRPLIAPERLLMLALLPWFREGSMPAWLRKRLVDAFSVSEYKTIRSVLSELLLTVFNFSRKSVQLEVSVEKRTPTASQVREHADAVMKDALLADFMATPPSEDRMRFALPAAIAKYLQAVNIPWVRSNPTSGSPLKTARANAEILRSTLAEAQVETVTVLRGAHPELGEQAGYRPVIDFVDRGGDKVTLGDGYFLFLPTGSRVARLLDLATATHLMQRTRLVTRMALLNLCFIVASAIVFSGGLLSSYNDAVAVAVVCMWLVLPYALMHGLVLRRFESCLALFPTFVPKQPLIYKATEFQFAPK